MKVFKTFIENVTINVGVNLIVIYLMVTNVIIVLGLKCVCNPQECDIIRPQDCPGKGFIVWDPCKCCKVCAKIFGEACGGPGGFSGKCEPPLQCISKPPVTGSGICLDLQHTNTLKCDETIKLEPGCEIVNRKCKCWDHHLTVCQNSQIHFDFKNKKECQLNLQNLVKSELEFDEDYTMPPSILAYKKARGRRRRTYYRLKKKKISTQDDLIHDSKTT